MVAISDQTYNHLSKLLVQVADDICYLLSSVVISVRVPESGVCVHISDEELVLYVCDVLYTVLYVRVRCFVVRGCAVSRRYIDVCNCDMFSVVNEYLYHSKFWVVCITGRWYVCCSDMSVMSPPPALCNLSACTEVKLCTLGVIALGVSLVS